MCPKCAVEGMTSLLAGAGMIGATVFMTRSYLALWVSSALARVRTLFSRRISRTQIDGA